MALLCAVCVLVVALSGCSGRNGIHTTTKGAVDATATAQAEGFEDSAAAVDTVAGKPWPAKVAKFAASVDYPVWYPSYVPTGFKVDTVDAVEFEPGAGVVCDILYLSGDKAITFTQGSPTMRDYEIVSSERAPWGSETADVMYDDPADPTSPALIVLSADGNLAELRGDVPLAELKKIAASMELVK